VEEVLIDTTGLWGLTFKDSKFHNFMENLAKQKRVLIPAIQMLELLVVVYRETSSHGESLERGLEQIQHISSLYSDIEKLKILEINIKFCPVEGSDIIKATELILEHPECFVREGPRKTKWLEFIDATTAAIWQKTRLTLYTSDAGLMKFGDDHKLHYKTIEGHGV